MKHTLTNSLLILVTILVPLTQPATLFADTSKSVYTVTAQPFYLQFILHGFFVSKKMRYIAFNPAHILSKKEKIAVIIPDGTEVKKGELLCRLSTLDINDTIQSLEFDHQLASIGLEKSKKELQFLEKSIEFELAAQKRKSKYAQEDLQRFLTASRQWEEKEAELSLQSQKNRLEYDLEELHQLQKMYNDDHLTEESEEIVLKRQRNRVFMQKFRTEYAKFTYEQGKTFNFPRKERHYKDVNTKEAFEWERIKTLKPLVYNTKELELEGLRLQQLQQEKKLTKLKKYRVAMEILAPEGGIVYYGEQRDGKWQDRQARLRSLRPEETIGAHKIIMTLVQPGDLGIQARIPEAAVAYLRLGSTGIVSSSAYPELRVKASISKIASIPFSDQSYAVTLAVDCPQDIAIPFKPGMKCRIEFIPYKKSKALIIPKSALATDPFNDNAHFVYLHSGKGDPKKRFVEIGKQRNEFVEILSGLKENDRILKKNPQNE